MYMKANETVLIKPMDLYNQKMSEDGILKLEFYDRYIIYSCNFFAEEPINRDDHELGWETVDNKFELIADKNAIIGFEKNWMHEYKYWTVYIFVNGMRDDIKMFFKKEQEANEVVEKLIKYLYD
jgi:hypothetical protein